MLTKFGNWIFNYRNFLFPIFYAGLFIPSPAIFADLNLAYLIGGIIILLGVLTRCITIGLVYIIRGGKKRQIYAETLVTDGIYSVCRNPMYLGNILLLLGFGLFANSLVFISTLFLLFLLFYVAIINAEQSFLQKQFGDAYTAYKAKTRALIPNFRPIPGIIASHTFNFTRVIIKEYNSLFYYFSGVVLILLYHKNLSLHKAGIILISGTVVYLIVKVLKRKGILKA